jgi:NAD(P)H-hydrate epimerase
MILRGFCQRSDRSVNRLYERYHHERDSRLVTAAEMKALDADTIERVGIPSLVLMERAALAVVERLGCGDFDLARAVCVCGTGNNGGDGIAIARLLSLAGHEALVVLVGDDARMSADARIQLAIAKNSGVRTVCYVDGILRAQRATTIVDALFGVGLTRPLAGVFAQAAAEINACTTRGAQGASEALDASDMQARHRAKGAHVLAVDVPSGISSDTGAILGVAVRADATVTFAYNKQGLAVDPGKAHAGDLLIADIGIYAPK